MHVLHRIAVQADNKEEAFHSVRSYLDNELESYQPWYDWFVTGGGRWNKNTDGYDDTDQSMTISYAEEPDKFVSAVNEAIELRKGEFAEYRKSFDDQVVDISDSLDKYDGTMDYSFQLYYLYKMIEMMNGKWDYNSYYFDITHESTNPKHVLDKVDHSWYLVYVDFHF